MSRVHVLVVGAGVAGSRRARCAAAHPRSRLAGVCDVDEARARALCDALGGRAFTDWRRALDELRPDVVVASTPNRWLMPVALAALERGAAVLVEKPFGRNLTEARAMADAARSVGRLLAVGLNHRHHPALARATAWVRSGAIGEPHFARCVYGHGGRQGYESEWRAHPDAGGGELLDQGVHVVDLLCQLLGRPTRVHAELATFAWPIHPLEDNAFALLRFPTGAIASLHVSWSQWQNRFQLHVYGADGAIEVDGLGGSYGEAAAVHLLRRDGRPPTREEHRGGDIDATWPLEWHHFLTTLDARHTAGNTADALLAMEVLDALYRSAHTGAPIDLPS